MSTLDWITVKGFKSIRSIEKLKICPINVLIGPNGSGKSNFIGVFSFLNAICAGDLENYVSQNGNANRILHFGSRTTPHLTIQVSFENEMNQYEITIESDDFDSMYPSDEYVYFWDKTKYDQPLKRPLIRRGGEAAISNPQSVSRIARYVRRDLDSWRLYHFHDTSSKSPMKQTMHVHDNRRLRPDGSNLASFLYFLREKHERSYNMIRRTVKLVAPFFDDFILEPLALNEDQIRLEWRHHGTDSFFDAASLSDGSLRFIALATLLLQPRELRPSVILLDEPELGLHPYAMTILASLIKQASVKTQIVIATQSSLLLDNFEPQNVLVAERVEGATQFTRLDGEKLKDWLEDYSLGQLWEKNELGGRPSPESTNRGMAQ